MPSKKTARPTKPKKQRINLTDYASDEFIIPASDDKGHSARVNVRIPTSFEREIAVIVGSRQFPFQEESDLVRWCIAEGLRALNRLEAIPNSTLAQAELVITAARTVLFQSQFEKTFAVFGEGIDVLRSAGAMDEIRRLYAQVRARIEEMPPDFWRAHYMTKLRTQWGHLVGDTIKPVIPGPGPTRIPEPAPAPAIPQAATGTSPAPPVRRRARGGPVDE